MMLGGESVLYDPDRLRGNPNFGQLGDPVTIITAPNKQGFVRVIHPVYGIQDVFQLHLYPMNGDCESR